LLLLSAVLLRAARVFRPTLPLFSAISFVACTALAQAGSLPFNLDLMSMGLLGMMVGFAPADRLDQWAANLPLIAIAYTAYSWAIHTWYPTYLINTVGVALTLLLLYSIGRRVDGTRFIARALTLMGNYSLLLYLVQIAALQALFRINRSFGAWEGAVIAPFLATTLITFITASTVDYLRTRSVRADRIYRGIFA
jgi:peptidoglycan/LPS O-acetylase OafA/YrhL